MSKGKFRAHRADLNSDLAPEQRFERVDPTAIPAISRIAEW